MRTKPFLPGATIGILGSGQLGRMMSIAANQLGFRVHCYSPETDSPAGQVCQREWVGAYEDTDLLREFALACDVVTYEFENVPLIAATTVEELRPLFPDSYVLGICQDRLQEKTFLRNNGIPVPEFHALRSEADINSLPADFSFPAVIKTARLGYDGKGQAKVSFREEIRQHFERFGSVDCILESFVDFDLECSVIVARNESEEIAIYPILENHHADHILDISLAPARVEQRVHQLSQEIARTIAEKLSLVGILAVEMFISSDGRVLVNELAPRPHNSGHLTIEACHCSQFQQVIRAICNLPLGTTALKAPAGMLNLLGDLWQSGEPDWSAVLKTPSLNLHLYGKREAKRGRKMGHLTLTGSSPDEIARTLADLRSKLTSKGVRS